MSEFILLSAISGSTPPSEFRLFRAGANRTKKGIFKFDAQSAQSVAANAAEWAVRHSIDYNHAALSAKHAENPAAAGANAGDFLPEVRNGELWATDVQWTEAAAERIRKREYLYFSPAFNHDKDGRVLDLINVAITNIPAMHGIDRLMALDATEEPLADLFHEEKQEMTKVFSAALGLSENAGEGELLSTITQLKNVATELSVVTGRSGQEALGVIRAWKDSHDRVATLSAELSAIQAAETARLIETAISEGKLTPAKRSWAIGYGAKDPQGLRTYLDASTPIVGMNATLSAPTAVETTVLSAEDKYLCKLLQLSPEQFLATRKSELSAGEV